MKKITKLAKKSSLLLSTEKVRQLNDLTLKVVEGGRACEPTNHIPESRMSC